MDHVNIILIILGSSIFLLIIFVFLFLNKETTTTDKVIDTEPNKNTDNTPTKENCEQTIIADYDEIDLNIVTKNALDTKIDLETEQKTFNPKDKIKKIPYVRTYLELPGYKSYNLESLNSMELKDNNYGLINYNELNSNERFKAKNSLI